MWNRDYFVPLQGGTNKSRVNELANRRKMMVMNSLFNREVSFGSSINTFDYANGESKIIDGLEVTSIDNLFAVIMPAGTGKTSLSKLLNVIDVDNLLIATNLSDALMKLRSGALRAVSSDEVQRLWREHNILFYGMLNKILSKMTFSEPQFILVHTEEMAINIGAIPLCALVLNDKVHTKNVSTRELYAQELSRMNKVHVMSRTSCPIHEYDSNDELAAFLFKVVGSYKEIPFPHRFSTDKFEYLGYDESVPREITSKLPVGPELTEQFYRLCKEGLISNASMAYYEREVFGVTTMEYGSQSDIQSTIEMAVLMVSEEAVRIDVDFDSDDMFEVYPHTDNSLVASMPLTLKNLLDRGCLSLDTKEMLRYHAGCGHAMAVCLALGYESLLRTRSIELMEAVERSGVFKVINNRWFAVHKKIHDNVRTTKCFFGYPFDHEERAMLMYTHILLGRGRYNLSEDQLSAEIIKRTRDLDDVKCSYDGVNWTNAQYNVDFDNALSSVYSSMRSRTNRPPDSINYDEFMKRRKRWCTTGSLGTVDPKIKKTYEVNFFRDFGAYYEKEIIKGRHNKKTIMESDEMVEHISDFLRCNPGYNKTTIQPKMNEIGGIQGEGRAILPGSIYHYVVFVYILLTAESCGQVGGCRMNVSDENDIVLVDYKIRHNSDKFAKFMYDFADYNAQHSVRDMKKVIQELVTHIPCDEDFVNMVGWLVASFDNMIVLKDDNSFVLNSGLYSGWRGTTWVNTVLNNVYILVAEYNYERLFNRKAVVLYDGAGDDVYLEVGDMLSAIRLYDCMCKMKLESKKIKQLFSSTVSEFLRVTYDENVGMACLMRGLGGFVSGNVEGRELLGFERLRETSANIDMLMRRGLPPSLARHIKDAVIKHLSKVKVDDHWVSLPDEFVHGSVENNCLGVADADGCIWKLKDNFTYEEPLSRTIFPANSATVDDLDIYKEELKRYNLALDVSKDLIQKMTSDSYVIDNVTMNIDKMRAMLSYTSEVEYKISVVLIDEVRPLDDMIRILSWDDVDESNYRNLQKFEKFKSLIDYLTDVGGNKVTKEGLFRTLVPQGWYCDYDMITEGISMVCPEYFSSICRKYFVNRAVYHG